jgi:hypothetical protein
LDAKDVPTEIVCVAEVASICSLNFPLYQGSQIHKFFDDLKSFVAKNQALLNVTNRSLVSGRNHIFGLTFVDLQSYFVRFSLQRQKRFPDGCLASTDNVDIIGVI